MLKKKHVSDISEFKKRFLNKKTRLLVSMNSSSYCSKCIFCEKCPKSKDFLSMIKKALYVKFAASQNYYYSKDITEILSSTRNKIAIKFKDQQTFDEDDEYLKRFYDNKELHGKLMILTEYYKFHRDVPRIFMISIARIMNYYHDKKRKIEYVRITKIIKEKNEQNKNKNPKHEKNLNQGILLDEKPDKNSNNNPTTSKANYLKILEDIDLTEEKQQKVEEHKINDISGVSTVIELQKKLGDIISEKFLNEKSDLYTNEESFANRFNNSSFLKFLSTIEKANPSKPPAVEKNLQKLKKSISEQKKDTISKENQQEALSKRKLFSHNIQIAIEKPNSSLNRNKDFLIKEKENTPKNRENTPKNLENTQKNSPTPKEMKNSFLPLKKTEKMLRKVSANRKSADLNYLDRNTFRQTSPKEIFVEPKPTHNRIFSTIENSIQKVNFGYNNNYSSMGILKRNVNSINSNNSIAKKKEECSKNIMAHKYSKSGVPNTIKAKPSNLASPKTNKELKYFYKVTSIPKQANNKNICSSRKNTSESKSNVDMLFYSNLVSPKMADSYKEKSRVKGSAHRQTASYSSNLLKINNKNELTEEEKEKYLQFLVTNNIVFEEEQENSNFVATIKFTQKNENEIKNESFKLEKNKKIDKNKKSNGSNAAFVVAGHSKKNKERKELGEIQNTYCGEKEDIWIKAGKQTEIKKRSHSSNQTEKNNSSNEKKSKIPKSIQNLKKFSTFYENFKFLDVNIHPKKYPKEWVLKMIEEIYTFKFNKDTKSIKVNKTVNSNSKENNLNEEFPTVVYSFFIEKFKNLKLSEQNAINFTATIEFYERENLDISIFSSFLTNDLDKSDLIFFLFVRSILEKEMGIQIYSALKKKCVDLNLVDISMKQCFHIVTTVFGPQEKDLINKFSIMIKSYFSNQKQENEKQTKMNAYQFLYLLVQEYHQNKFESQNKATNLTSKDVRSLENCTTIDTSFNCGHKNIDSGLIVTTTKNLKPEFDNVFNEMINKHHEEEDANEDNDDPNDNDDNDDDDDDDNDNNHSSSQEKEFAARFPELEIGKVSSNGSSNDNFKSREYSEFEKIILNKMEKNVSDFVDLLLDENSEFLEEKELVKLKINKIVLRKIHKLCESLFDYDKLNWFKLLKIENPSSEQLLNVETLQKDLRKIQKSSFLQIERKELKQLCKNILQTPELVKEIGRLVVAFMLT